MDNYCNYSTADGHGGKAREHRAEMREIALQTIREEVPQMCEKIFAAAVDNLVGAIEYDITTVFELVSADTKDIIFNDKRISKVVSEEICRRLQADINKMDFTFNL